MKIARVTIAGCAVATVMVGAATTGCGSGNKASSPSAAGPTASPTGPPLRDYTALLINASDIGGDFTSAQPPSQNPNGMAGVAQLFTGPDNSRRIGDTIMIAADAAAAVAGLENSKKNFTGNVSGGTWQPADVGSNGAILSGTSPDNSQAVIVLFFTEGKALVDLEFNSAPTDPFDPGVALDIGRKQDAAIKSGLPS